MQKWQDTREFLGKAGQIHVEPYVRDIFVYILPGFVLVMGIFAMLLGFYFTSDLVSAVWSTTDIRSWIIALFAFVFAWFVGAMLRQIGLHLGYAKSIQPNDWDKYIWLEAIQDYDDQVELSKRRKASSFQTASWTCVGLGTACLVLLLAKIVSVGSFWAWVLLLLLASMILLTLLHRFLDRRWTVFISVLLAILLIATLFRLSGPWPALLLVGVVGFRLLHLFFHNRWHHTIQQEFPTQRDVEIRPREEPLYLGRQEPTSDDEQYAGSKFADVKDLVCANPYYQVWGDGQTELPVYRVTLGSVLRGILPHGNPYQFREAARRAVDTRADLRQGTNGRGFRRLLHPNGVCLFGTWEITNQTAYTGYFAKGKKALLIGRYSTCCTEVRRGRSRSLSLVGKLFPTNNEDEKVKTASFITQEDLGGNRLQYVNDAEFRNAPDTTAWRRGLGLHGLPVISITGILFRMVDVEPAIRQLYEIAELDKDENVPTSAPKFMRIRVDENQPRIEGKDLDFRDEVMGQIYDPGDETKKRSLIFNIEVSDEGTTLGPAFFQRRKIKNWQHIGKIVFSEGVISYNGDQVIHFNHPTWRLKRNDPASAARLEGVRVR